MGIVTEFADDPWIRSINGENLLLPVCFYLDPLDRSAIPLRPVDEPWMEETDTAGIDQYGDYGGGDIVDEKSRRKKEKKTGSPKELSIF